MKQILMVIFLLISGTLFSQSLHVVVDQNRFLDDVGNTIFDFNYQIPYKSLQFNKTKSGFSAALKVEYLISQGETVIDKGDFTSKIVFPNKEMTRSGKLFRDKIAVTLPNSEFKITLKFVDENSLNFSDWSNKLEVLKKDSFLSDLEFSANVVTDTTGYLEKFHRGDQLFFVSSDHIFSKSEIDSIFIYYELGNAFFPVGNLNKKISVLKDTDTVKVFTEKLNCRGKKISKISTIDISEFEAGYYDVIVEVNDPISNAVNIQKDYFSIKQENTNNFRIFVDIEDEITLLKYFLPSSKTKIWENLSLEGKKHFINRFWQANDKSIDTEKNEFFDTIKQRVQYCNEQFSHFEDGWHTDRGRIYIKYGKPDDIVLGDTGLQTKYPRKKYEIWKYRVSNNLTYLFLDLSSTNNYKLILSENDDQESSSPHFKEYLGEDFDESLLD